MRITIKTFQDLFIIQQTPMDELDKSILLVQTLTGKSQFEIERMKVSKFNKLCAKINKMFEALAVDMTNGKPKNIIRANGKFYFINYEINKLTAGRYVETATFGNDIVGNLHKLLATMANPMKMTLKGLKVMPYDANKHEQISEDMLQADFTIAYQACVFFYALFTNSIQSLVTSLEQNEIESESVKSALMNFKEAMDGYTMPNWYKNLSISV